MNETAFPHIFTRNIKRVALASFRCVAQSKVRATVLRVAWQSAVQVCMALMAIGLVAADANQSAASKVIEGLQHFFAQDFDGAEESFEQAGELQPDNDIIQFDQACTAMAQGGADRARSLFKTLTLSKDTALAIRCHYNLGCLSSDAAKSKLGDDPAAAVGETREESVQLLLTAVRHYRDVLQLDADHKDARHNIELIRLFIKHIQSQWQERDKQKDRQDKDLLQFLLMMEQRQSGVQSQTTAIQDQKDAPDRRQQLRELADRQTDLTQEIPPLKEKIEQAFTAAQQQTPPSGATATAASNEQTQQMLSSTLTLADDIGRAMNVSAGQINSADFIAAADSQRTAMGGLNRLYMMAAPYQTLLQRSLETQEKLTPPATKNEGASDEQEAQTEPVVATKPRSSDLASNLFDQGRVSEWADVLALKAEAELPAAQQQLAALPQPESAEPDQSDPTNTVDERQTEPGDTSVDDSLDQTTPTASDSGDETPVNSEVSPEPQQQQQIEQLQGLVESMQRAIELAPTASQHASEAAAHLLAKSPKDAIPEQAETLRLLKEIAEPLKSDQQEDSQDDQQEDQNQEQPNGDQQDSDSQDDQSQQQQDEDQESAPPQDQEREKQQQEEQQQQKAESVIRQARERERDYRDMLKAQQKLLGRKIPVDKDW